MNQNYFVMEILLNSEKKIIVFREFLDKFNEIKFKKEYNEEEF